MKRQETIDAFFTEAEEQRIIAAIQTAEKQTSGEIRVHLEEHSEREAFEEAVRVFEELGMYQTEQRNAALILLLLQDHRFAIVGDEGINKVVPENFWDSTAAAMRSEFQAGNFVEGLEKGIAQLGEQLKAYYSYQDGDINELPDTLSS